MDLISVIVPVYNLEQYLPRCLDSIVGQTYKELEIILVDDGSTDHSGDICRSYSERYPNVYYYPKTNGGLSDARNYGLKKANGSYVGFVDSDDWIDADMYQVLYDDMIRYDADISIVGFDMGEGTGWNKNASGAEVAVLDPESAIKILFQYDNFGNYAWNKLYKRELFEGIEYPLGKRLEDVGTTYNLFLRADKITYDPIELYHYFQREGSILHDPYKAVNGYFKEKLELIQDRFLALRELFPDMEENTDFYLDTVLSCLPYAGGDPKLFRRSISVFRSVDLRSWKHFSKKRRLKAALLYCSPFLFMKIFGKE